MAHRYSTQPVVRGDTLVVAASKQTRYSPAHLFALDRRSSDLMWEAEYRDIGIPTLVPAEQRVFFASAAQVRAVDVESGAGGWHTSLKGDPIHFYTNGPPALDDGTLYVAGHEGPGSRGKGRLVALDTQQGEPRWKFDTGTALRSPVVADGRVYVSDVEADTLYAFPAQPSSPPPLTSQD